MAWFPCCCNDPCPERKCEDDSYPARKQLLTEVSVTGNRHYERFYKEAYRGYDASPCYVDEMTCEVEYEITGLSALAGTYSPVIQGTFGLNNCWTDNGGCGDSNLLCSDCRQYIAFVTDVDITGTYLRNYEFTRTYVAGGGANLSSTEYESYTLSGFARLALFGTLSSPIHSIIVYATFSGTGPRNGRTRRLGPPITNCASWSLVNNTICNESLPSFYTLETKQTCTRSPIFTGTPADFSELLHFCTDYDATHTIPGGSCSLSDTDDTRSGTLACDSNYAAGDYFYGEYDLELAGSSCRIRSAVIP